MRKQMKAPFDNYSIDEYGFVFNENNHQMACYIADNGHYQLKLETKNGREHPYPHRLVAEYFLDNWDPKLDVDHIDMNKLNNHYSNLRMATRSQNNANTDKRTNNISGFKGVYWNTQKNKWNAKSQKDGKQYHFGYFDNKLDAARAYMEGAKKLHGEYARWTTIPETDDDFFNIATTIPLPESPKPIHSDEPKLKIKFI